MIERLESQKNNSTLKLANSKEKLRKNLDIEKERDKKERQRW